ncbi:MAG: DUF2914 domain-containing protein [Desulfobacteraceae bacterium]|nr:DUF2914 domain-containing protein [Desulfobacteraceae bacterium]
MKRIFYQTGFLFVFVTVLFVIPLIAQAENKFPLTVFRSSVCYNIVEHEPLDIGTTFTNDVKKLYCFSEIMGAKTNTHITHVWYYMGAERARKQLRVHGTGWRTYSSKLIQSHETGNWEVKIVDAEEKLLKVLKFNITPK